MNKNIIEHGPSLISIFTAVVIAVSIVYEYGFLLGIGLTFAEVPTTLSDHIRGSLIWVPPLLFILLINIGLELFFRRAEKGMTEDEIVSTSPSPKKTKFYRDLPSYFMVIVALCIPVLYFFGFKIRPMVWAASVLVLWFVFHSWSFSHERILQRTAKWFSFATLVIPIVIIFAFFSGLSSANRVAIGTKYMFNINNEKKVATIARIYEKYYLLWNITNKNIEIISSDTVKSFYPVKVDTNKTSE